MKIGEYKLYSIETSEFALDGGAMFGIIPKVMWSEKMPSDLFNRITMVTRSLLLVNDSRKILIDTGNGSKWSEKYLDIYNIDLSMFNIKSSLGKYNFIANDITDVICTHLHFDHAGGNTIYHKESLIPTFPNATYWISDKNWRLANHPNQKDRGSFMERDWKVLGQNNMIHLVNDKFLPGIDIYFTKGHTDGLMHPIISDSKKTLFAELVNTNKGDAKLNNLEIAEHMIFLLLAAHDTTTITLTNSIYNLSKNKDYAYDLFNEANEVDHLDVSSLKNGIVAESIFKEAMRYYPPVPFSVRQVVRDTQIEKYNITKDSYLTISPLLLHHDDRYWNDPQKFDPYRFIDPAYINQAYFPFAGGAHTCIGKFFASYLFKNVIYKYIQSIQSPQIDHVLDIRPTPIPHPVKDVKVLI